MPLNELILFSMLLLLSTVLLATLADRLRIPYAILLVLGGGVLGFIPGIPHIELDPELILLFFLPPLIYSSAWLTSWHRFRKDFDFILLLAIGLVLATMVAVAVVAHLFIPQIPWAVAFVLGAVVSPTDTVAAGTVIKGQGLIRRISSVIESESLVNDATGLVAYRFAVGAAVTGSFSLVNASIQFFVVSLGGLLIGLLVALIASFVHKQLEDSTTQVMVSVATAFASYILAEKVGVSGVLAAVTTGLYLGQHAATFYSSETRLQANSFWNVLTFMFNSFIFFLIGFQMQNLLYHLSRYSLSTVFVYILLISITVVVVRMFWTFASIGLLHILPASNKQLGHNVSWRYAAVIGWTGMRGGVSLASALAIPIMIASGAPFPERDLIVFLTFGVILFTLVVQGFSLAPLIRWFKVDNDPTLREETRDAIIASTQAALQKLDELKSGQDETGESDERLQKYIERLKAYYEKKLALLEQSNEDTESVRKRRKATQDRFRRIQREIHQEERGSLIALRKQGEIDDQVFHTIERDLDLEEQRLYQSENPRPVLVIPSVTPPAHPDQDISSSQGNT
ncbi:Na+/H+ antiporter [Dictyobacter arantiisoli]|uniref:Na+/H+ antiporter n=1 Tax=Dictyobacter arantiisoli TaxID=2014874 RepID=A0A5A5TJI3_9CHLR|nr:Na+/H+ antiporter [Dictyobacter arantiisoli]GCF11405.1 Na+/H+ antiporter [Dictyobacter arantiisoli]